MTFESIYATAMETINSMIYNGYQFASDATVCVIISATGRVYSGVSSVYIDAVGIPMSVHAEINAVNNMTAFGEYLIDSFILIEAVSRLALLPCSECLNYIVSVNQNNMNAFVAMPGRMIKVSEVGIYAQGGMQPGQLYMEQKTYQNVSSESIMASGGSSKGDLLKDKINKLIIDNDEDDDNEYMEGLNNSKKKFFGLF